jgi:hypothetical protein
LCIMLHDSGHGEVLTKLYHHAFAHHVIDRCPGTSPGAYH